MRVILRCGTTFVLAASLFGQAPMPVSTTKEATLPTQPAASATAPLAPTKAAPVVAELPANTPIVTLQGVCDDAPASKVAARTATAKNVSVKTGATKRPVKTCKTVITKGQMDALIDVLLPAAPAETRRQFALNYIRMLAASGVAKDKNLWQDPAVGKEMEARVDFTRMQVMASALYHRVETLANEVPDSEVESYYNAHKENYIQGDVQRISLVKSLASKGTVPATAEELAALKAKAEAYQARAAKGEDFDALQKEIIQTLNPGAPVPLTKISMIRRTALPPAEGIVFDLKPGEVTQVVEAQGAFEVLKLVSLQTVPLDSVHADIKAALTNGHLQLLMKDATKNVTANFNLAYLNLPTAPELFLSPTLRGPTRPGAGPAMQEGRPNPGGMQHRRPMPQGAFPQVQPPR